MTFRPTIHVVDDDSTTRSTLSDLIRSAGMSERYYNNAGEFLRSAERALPGCILLELALPDMSGLELQSTLGRSGYRPPIIFVTSHGDVPSAVQAMRGGAVDFMAKPVADDRLLDNVRKAVALDLKRRRKAARRATVRARLDLLTRRERQVLDGVVDGRSNKEIGRDLGISYKTVELHRGNMMAKLHAESIAQLVRFALDGAITSRPTGDREAQRSTAGASAPAPAPAQAAGGVESLYGAPR
ncbi:MAG: response regulator [Halofilum sp. (in: g-proteobacteria)]